MNQSLTDMDETYFSQDLYIFLLITIKWIAERGMEGNSLLSSNYLVCRKFSALVCTHVVKSSPPPFPSVITAEVYKGVEAGAVWSRLEERA